MDNQPNPPKEDQLTRDDRRARTWQDYAKFGFWVFLTIDLALLGWGLWSWRNSSNVVGATQAKLSVALDGLIAIEKTINDKVGLLDVEAANQRVKDLGPTQQAATALLTGITESQAKITRAAVAQIDHAGQEITAIKGATEELTRQAKQNGDAAHAVLVSANRTIKDADLQITKLGSDGSLLLQTANAKVAREMDDLHLVTIDADKTIKGLSPLEANLAGITDDFHGMTTDSRKKLHELFYPAPVHGFWPNAKRIFSYVANPIFEGSRLYFSLRAWPVRVVSPIPKLP